MERKSFEDAACPIARSLDVLGDWWAPLILRECLYSVHRFDGFQKNLGIGRNILTRRLALLVDKGVLEKRQYQERPPRYEYHLTDMGYDAATLLLAMMPFGDRHFFDGRPPNILLYDRESGRQVTPVIVDEATGERIDAKRLYAGPGPSFPNSEDARRSRFREYYERRDES